VSSRLSAPMGLDTFGESRCIRCTRCIAVYATLPLCTPLDMVPKGCVVCVGCVVVYATHNDYTRLVCPLEQTNCSGILGWGQMENGVSCSIEGRSAGEGVSYRLPALPTFASEKRSICQRLRNLQNRTKKIPSQQLDFVRNAFPEFDVGYDG
jgi:hypothetical protein